MTEREKFAEKYSHCAGIPVESVKFDSYGTPYVDTVCSNSVFLNTTVKAAYWGWQAAAKDAVPEGWKLVPVEPTEDMIKKAQIEFFRNHPYENFDDWTVAGYKTMLAAAPEVK